MCVLGDDNIKANVQTGLSLFGRSSQSSDHHDPIWLGDSRRSVLQLPEKYAYVVARFIPLTMSRSLDEALDDDDAAIRALNNNIDVNGTGIIHILAVQRIETLASMLANLIRDGEVW